MKIERLGEKYRGKMAATYDENRVATLLWQNEQRIVADMLSSFGPGSRVLDVPVGTARFLNEFKALELEATGVDISQDMLAKARVKADQVGVRLDLVSGDVFALACLDKQFDVTVCIRLMQWLSTADCLRALRELVRVSNRAIICYVPVYTPSSLLLSSGLRGSVRLLKQWKLKFYRARKRVEQIIHDTSKVERGFRELGLTIERVENAETPEIWEWQRGVENRIYLLRLPTPGHGEREHRHRESAST